MFKKLCLLLCLILRVVAPVFAAEERKGLDREEVQAAEGVVGDDSGLDLETDYQIFFVPQGFVPPKKNDPEYKKKLEKYPCFFAKKSFIDKFEILIVLSMPLYGQISELEDLNDDTNLYLPDSVVSFEDLSDLQGLISNPNDLEGFDFIRLAQLLNLANELGAKKQTKDLLEPVMNYLRQDIKIIASPELALEIKNGNGDIKLPLIQDIKSNNFLEHVSDIVYSPDGSSYWVIGNDRRAQKYNAAGVAQGEPFVRAIGIVYSPDGTSYWVIGNDRRTQRYNAAGVAQGELLEGVSDIMYSPDGSDYWVIHNSYGNYRAQIYNAAGVAQGEPFVRAIGIFYSPDGSSYWVIDLDRRTQRYNEAGVAQGEPLVDVSDIAYSPDGSSYWVIDLDRRAQRYNAAGVMQGEPLDGFRNIVYSPDGSDYWVIDWDRRAQRYNAAGLAQGEPLEGVRNIVYSPDGSSYLVIGNDHRTQRYNSAGVAQGEPLEHVENIVYSPDSTSYLVIGDDRRAYHTFKFSGLPLYQQVMIQWVFNKFESNDKKAINLDTEQLAILNSKLINDLLVAGYINQPGVSGGGAGIGAGVSGQ